MNGIIEVLSGGQKIFVELATILCNFIGVTILLITVVNSFIKYFHHDRRTKLTLARGIALALEFKLAGEVLRTVTVRTWNELAILGTIVLLRAAISFLIHWEIKADRIIAEQEKRDKKE